MRSRLLLVILGLTALAGGLVAKGLLRSHAPAPADVLAPAQRIVSISPSCTEALFALGLDDRVIGVTRYCKYPPEAQSKPIVGGYLDPNYETILSLQPDLIVLRGENAQSVEAFERLGLKTLSVRHDSVEGILESFLAIGRACDVDAKAEELVATLRAKMERLENRMRGLPRPSVLLVADRSMGTGRIEHVYVTGGDGFMNRMIALAGGRNACPDASTGYPEVSAEGILTMNPDVIVDFCYLERQGGLDKEQVLRDWRQLPEVEAVRKGRVHLINDDFAFIPGPRFILLAEKLAELIHPGKGDE